MNIFKVFLLCSCFLFSLVFAGDFQKDEQLVEQYQKNNLRLIVVCCYEGTNNLLDIVTSNSTPGYELTACGIHELNSSVPLFSSQNISHIFTSPLYRAQQATNLLGKALYLTKDQLSLDQALTMQSFGSSEEVDFDIYKKNFDLEASADNLFEGTPPNGEAGLSVFNRTHDFLQSLNTIQNQTVMLITHGFNFCHIRKCLTGEYGDLPQLGAFEIFDFSSN